MPSLPEFCKLEVALIATKEFIAAIASEAYGEPTCTGVAAKQLGGNQGWICKWL
jgi:hypothetical protein